MKRARGLVVVTAACATAACQLVAGIQDRVLVTADAASNSGASAPDASFATGTPDAEGSLAADGPASDSAEPTDGGSPAPPDSPDLQGDAAASNDATMDATSTPLDAGIFDAQADAGPVGDAADGSFGTPCAQVGTALFCDDFDSVTDATAGWSWTAFNLDSGSIQLSQDAPATPPNDLQIVVPGSAAGSYSFGKNLGTLGEFTLAFDLRLDVDSLDAIPYVIIAQVIVGAGDGGDVTFNYALGSGAARAVQIFFNGQQTSSLSLPAPPTRQWTHITIAYSTASGFTTTQDGTSLGSIGNIGGDAAPSTFAPGAATLIAGDVYGSPPYTGTLAYSLDDIVIQGSQ